MNFTEAIKTCFQKYATFSGRARRSEYWYFVLFCFVVSIILRFVDKFLFAKGIYSPVTIFGRRYFIGLLFIFYLVTMIPNLAVAFRRLHDIGKSGWFYLPVFLLSESSIFINVESLMTSDSLVISLILGIIVLAYEILILVWLFRDSEPGENQWGPNPKGIQNNMNY